jgi:hypothetical protein
MLGRCVVLEIVPYPRDVGRSQGESYLHGACRGILKKTERLASVNLTHARMHGFSPFGPLYALGVHHDRDKPSHTISWFL